MSTEVEALEDSRSKIEALFVESVHDLLSHITMNMSSKKIIDFLYL